MTTPAELRDQALARIDACDRDKKKHWSRCGYPKGRDCSCAGSLGEFNARQTARFDWMRVAVVNAADTCERHKCVGNAQAPWCWVGHEPHPCPDYTAAYDLLTKAANL